MSNLLVRLPLCLHMPSGFVQWACVEFPLLLPLCICRATHGMLHDWTRGGLGVVGVLVLRNFVVALVCLACCCRRLRIYQAQHYRSAWVVLQVVELNRSLLVVIHHRQLKRHHRLRRTAGNDFST